MTSKIDAAKIMLSMNSEMVISKGDAINPLMRLKKSSTSTWFKSNGSANSTNQQNAKLQRQRLIHFQQNLKMS